MHGDDPFTLIIYSLSLPLCFGKTMIETIRNTTAKNLPAKWIWNHECNWIVSHQLSTTSTKRRRQREKKHETTTRRQLILCKRHLFRLAVYFWVPCWGCYAPPLMACNKITVAASKNRTQCFSIAIFFITVLERSPNKSSSSSIRADDIALASFCLTLSR